MSTADRIAELSPQKRALLLAKLQEKKRAAAEARPAAGPSAAAALEPLPRPREPAALAYPVSFSQLREWILDRFDPGTAAYNIPMWIDLEGRIEVPALAGALGDLGARHDALRTRFRPPGAPDGEAVFLSQAGERFAGEPEQVVEPAVAIDLPVIDLSGLPAPARAAAAGRLERGHARLGFDLAEAPLFRTALLRLEPAAHRLLLSIHHIVSDGWSMGVLFRDLGALYLRRAGAPAGLAAPLLRPLPLGYGDYAAWQRRRLQGETLDKLLAYWRGRLAGVEPVLELPTDRPRSTARSLAAGNFGYRVAPELAAAVRRAARRHEVSLFMVLLAAFDVVFHRLSGQTDLSIGTFIANRNRAETTDLVGFFVNTLVLRVGLDGDPTLAEVLARVRGTTLGAYDHQDLPFEKLLDALQPKRDPGRTPLFQALVVLQNLPTPKVETSGLTLRTRSAETLRANFELSAYLNELDGSGRLDGEPGIGGVLEYDRDLFDATTIERWARSIDAVLEAIARRPDARLSELSGALAGWGAAERHQLCHEWGEAPSSPPTLGAPSEATVVELLAERAAEAPAAPALESAAGEATSYGDLAARVAALAAGLRRSGVMPGEVIGVFAPSGPEAVVSFLGVLAAGAAYLPLDPGYPAERLAWLVGDAGAALVLAAGPRTEAHEGLGAPVADPAELEAAGAAEGSTALALGRLAPPPAEALAYVLYTSGSTGQPKGVEVTHANLARYARIAADGYRLGPGDRVLQFATLTFDASAEEIYPCLAAGATLVFRDAAAPPAPTGLMELVARRGVTVLDLPTAYWHTLVAAREGGGTPLPESLRLVILGGEAALPEAVAAWRRSVGGGVRLVNTYGPTEATIVSSWCDLAGADAPERPVGAVPIGRPIPGTRLLVADRALAPVPAGATGEVLIGGGGVARGYRGRPSLTARNFVPDPFALVGGARLYRSGDLGRWLPKRGEIEFAGRLDDQVKVRGYRIEPGEVEAALAALPGVREAAVVARKEASGAHRLVAYVVAAPHEIEAEADMSAVRDRLAARLPPHMVPSAFVALDAMPLTAQGKVDRRRLPDPADGGASGAREGAGAPYAAPRTPAERALAEVWRDVLGVERAGIHDNFFDLGGDSLLLLQVHERITREGGPAGAQPGNSLAGVEVLDLFRFPTIEALAAHAQPSGGEARSTIDAAAERATRQRAAIRSRPAERGGGAAGRAAAIRGSRAAAARGSLPPRRGADTERDDE